MTQEKVVEMTLQAGWTGIYSQWVSPTERQHLTVPVTIEQIETFAKLVAAKERRECAKFAAEVGHWGLVHEIEAMGNKHD